MHLILPQWQQGKPVRNIFAGRSAASFKTPRILILEQTFVSPKVKEFYHVQENIYRNRHYRTEPRSWSGIYDQRSQRKTPSWLLLWVLHADLRVFILQHGLQFLQFLRRKRSRRFRGSHHAGANTSTPGSKQVIHS
jgi:hypothetical protein